MRAFYKALRPDYRMDIMRFGKKVPMDIMRFGKKYNFNPVFHP